jgi:hypothetical protein
MTHDTRKPPGALSTTAPNAAQDQREARLAAALRTNLRRRKAGTSAPAGAASRPPLSPGASED